MNAKLIYDGKIGRTRLIAFLVDPKELKKHEKQAREETAEYLKYMLRDYFKDISDEEFEKLVEKIRKGEKTLFEILDEYGVEPDFWYADVDEKTAEFVAGKLFSDYLDRPVDPQVSAEPGYGLPEYSLYGGYDARSWFGRWWWSGSPKHIDESEICFGMPVSEAECIALVSRIRKIKEIADKQGKLAFVAYWVEKEKK